MWVPQTAIIPLGMDLETDDALIFIVHNAGDSSPSFIISSSLKEVHKLEAVLSIFGAFSIRGYKHVSFYFHAPQNCSEIILLFIPAESHESH